MMVTEAGIERVARILCRVDREDPEMIVFIGTPVLVRGGYLAYGAGHPAWTLRRGEARAALEEALLIFEEGE